jgi:uncharacterized protein
MTNGSKTEVAALLQPMIKKTLWAVLSTAVVPSEQMEPIALEHLKYMNSLEARGLLWASGPFVVSGVTVGDGLTIFNVRDESEVCRLMDAEPLTRLGMRNYLVHKWELREGAISLTLNCSQSKFGIT